MLQQELVEKRVAGEIPDTVLLLEHEPVITRGRGLQFTGEPRPRHMPAPVGLPSQIAFADSERGGDLTYHGPGQLVIYPIVKLDGSSEWAPHHDITSFLRRWEQMLIDVLAELGLKAESRENATGVWVGSQKLVSIGIAVRKWVTWHGLAINVVNDLSPFSLISPCGYSPEVMTNLKMLLPAEHALQGPAWRAWLEERLVRQFLKQPQPAL